MIYRTVTAFLSGVFLELIRSSRQNIELGRDLKALFETVDFVEREMAHVSSSPDPDTLLLAAVEAARAQGLFVEFGVHKARTINLISKRVNQTVYGFDSFEGLPEFWRDTFEQGAFAMARQPKVNPNVELIKGWFSDTLPGFLKAHPEKFSFVHVDSDLYSSAATILTLAEDRFQEGTVIVFDEYFNYPGWQRGEHLAFREFLARTKFTFEYLSYCRIHEQVSVRLKSKGG